MVLRCLVTGSVSTKARLYSQQYSFTVQGGDAGIWIRISVTQQVNFDRMLAWTGTVTLQLWLLNVVWFWEGPKHFYCFFFHIPDSFISKCVLGYLLLIHYVACEKRSGCDTRWGTANQWEHSAFAYYSGLLSVADHKMKHGTGVLGHWPVGKEKRRSKVKKKSKRSQPKWPKSIGLNRWLQRQWHQKELAHVC